MKSLILLLSFLLSGLTYANAQTPPEQTRPEQIKPGQIGGGTGKMRDALFPDFKKDIANLQSKSVRTKPDLSVVSTSTKRRLFTNYQPTRSTGTLNKAAAQQKAATIPSDISAKESANNLKQDKSLQPATHSVPNQDGGGASAPHKKN
ncbi:MAG: hypothetical protein J7623_04730 [Chitinophaga sp.]|uniref:hypothetical protein n=1 Tax=Chitinophaga sp. TaxID=1869181 RepID=UPI001B05613A|nr:hypothetical protein [Chitinophaga sp.]MBO9727923.1 hypothetical protein [Chitinophaga sp.]